MIARILGLAKLNAKLKRLPTAPKEEIRRAMEAQAERIVATAQNLAPVDDGDLRESIGWTWGKVPRGAITIGKLFKASLGGDLTITIYAGNDKAFYARWVEFGTAPHDQPKRGISHPGSAAQPFFYPAYRANKKSVKRAVRKAVRDAAKKVAAS